MRLLFAAIVLLLVSCRSDAPQFNPNHIHGTWMFAEAYRDGKETKTLETGYMDFDTTNMEVTSNIFQSDGTKSFEVSPKVIKIIGDESFEMNIRNFSKDTLLVDSRMWNFDMEFVLVRQTDGAENQEM